MGSQVERTHSKAAAGGPGQARWQLAEQERWQLVDWAVPHSLVDKLGGTTGERDRPHNPGFQNREIKPQNLWLKTPVGVEAKGGETPSLTREFMERPTGS